MYHEKSHELTEKKLELMEKRLTRIYSEAQKGISEKTKAYFDKFAELDEKKRMLVEKGVISEESYKEWRKSKIAHGKHFTAMKEQIATELANVNKTALAYINGELPEIYLLNYNAIADVVDGIGGYSFELVDAETVKFLATTNEELLPYKFLDTPKDKRWNKKKLNSQVLQGIIQGETIPEITKRLVNVTGMNKSNAVTNARTMVTGAENRGRIESMKKAQKDGILLRKEWISSDQPGRTRDWHLSGAFERLVVEVDEPFVNELGEIMFPGDPSAHPANVYGCRCTLGYVVDGFRKVKR